MGTAKRLFLHVGTHKTGTTSFQHALVEHRKRLTRHGLAVYTETNHRGRTMANAAALGNAVLRPSLRTGARLRGRQTEPDWRDVVSHAGAVRAAIANAGTPDAVVSAEALCFARTRREAWRMRAILQWLDVDEVIPLLVTRGAEAWRASWEAQLEKAAQEIGRTDRGDGTDDILGDWYYDLDAIRRFWSRFGDVRVIEYERALDEHGSVIPALMSAMDQPPDLIAKEYRLNRR